MILNNKIPTKSHNFYIGHTVPLTMKFDPTVIEVRIPNLKNYTSRSDSCHYLYLLLSNKYYSFQLLQKSNNGYLRAQ